MTTGVLNAYVRRGQLPSGLATLDIDHPLAQAQVALQGGQVLHWQPNGHAPVLWQSSRAHAQIGRSVRGGIPICWPWFGPGAAGQAAHGFARTRNWQVQGVTASANGVQLRLALRDDASTRAIWNHAFDLDLVVHIGQTLELFLNTHNRSAAPMHITQALHSYFACADITQTQVLGLEATPYADKVHAARPDMQHGPVRFVGETDRVYGPTTADCLIEDPGLGRRLRVAKSGSRSTVVWNPWQDKAGALGDMAACEYRQMLCVETANAGDDAVQLAPGEHHTLGLRLSVAPMPPSLGMR